MDIYLFLALTRNIIINLPTIFIYYWSADHKLSQHIICTIVDGKLFIRRVCKPCKTTWLCARTKYNHIKCKPHVIYFGGSFAGPRLTHTDISPYTNNDLEAGLEVPHNRLGIRTSMTRIYDYTYDPQLRPHIRPATTTAVMTRTYDYAYDLYLRPVTMTTPKTRNYDHTYDPHLQPAPTTRNYDCNYDRNYDCRLLPFPLQPT